MVFGNLLSRSCTSGELAGLLAGEYQKVHLEKAKRCPMIGADHSAVVTLGKQLPAAKNVFLLSPGGRGMPRHSVFYHLHETSWSWDARVVSLVICCCISPCYVVEEL